jgi:hypothetical protein
MPSPVRAYTLIALTAAVVLTAHSGPAAAAIQSVKPAARAEVSPEVEALLKQSTDAYKKMKSYRHTARWTISAKSPDGERREDLTFTLALDRPNKFAYKMDTKSEIFPPAAAYCDGITFINFKARLAPVPSREYTKTPAPPTFKGINIVDDVEFQPIATYIIALMLQGDVLADKDVRAAMVKATIKPTVTEGGKKWQVLEMPFGAEETPITLYIGQDDHLIGKAIQAGSTKIVETIDAVKIDKPIEPAVFQYSLPADARQVQHFSAPQRPDDAILHLPPRAVARR